MQGFDLLPEKPFAPADGFEISTIAAVVCIRLLVCFVWSVFDFEN
jgi:hypothetical protein